MPQNRAARSLVHIGCQTAARGWNRKLLIALDIQALFGGDSRIEPFSGGNFGKSDIKSADALVFRQPGDCKTMHRYRRASTALFITCGPAVQLGLMKGEKNLFFVQTVRVLVHRAVVPAEKGKIVPTLEMPFKLRAH